MSISEKVKTIDNKIELCFQYDLDRQTAKISGFSSGNVSKSEFMTVKDILPGNLLEKPETMKRFEHSPLGKQWKHKMTLHKTVSKIREYL